MASIRRIWLLSSLIAATSVTGVFAGYTDVYQPPGGERNHADIFDDIYGGTFTGQGTALSYGMWTEYSNDSISSITVVAYRIDDFDEAYTPPLNICTGQVGEVVDQIWTDGVATVTAEAKYAAFNQSFGWNRGEGENGLGTYYYELLTDDDIGEPGVSFDIAGDFLWGIQPDGFEWWSLTCANDGEPDPYDHMVTYKIEGLVTNQTVWTLFFEDLPSCRTDRDYNDFVVEIRAIPEPGTIALLGVGGLITLLTRERRFV